MMGSLSVEPGEPFEQSLVELRQVVEEQRLVHIEEFLLYGAVEALAVSIHFGSAWKGVPVEDLLGLQSAVEVPREPLTVVREYSAHGHRKEGLV